MKNGEQIRQLREQGLTLKITHNRMPTSVEQEFQEYAKVGMRGVRPYMEPKWAMKDNGLRPSGFGGETVVSVYDAEETLLAEGVATCSVLDNFDHQIGLRIALGRALAELGANKAFA